MNVRKRRFEKSVGKLLRVKGSGFHGSTKYEVPSASKPPRNMLTPLARKGDIFSFLTIMRKITQP